MNLINRKHPEILEIKQRSDCFLSITDLRLWFSSTAATRFNLEPGKYLHFLNDGKSWSFFQNDDPDGFFIQKNGRATSQAVVVTCKPLIRMMLKSTGYKSGTRFYILKSNATHDGHPVMEIVTNKTFEEFMKAPL
jgi:hypothetical protein